MKRIEQPVTIVVFGASGDLSKRKLIPALYHLAYQNLLPHNFMLIGYGRTKFTDEQFRHLAYESLHEFGNCAFDDHVWHAFSQCLYYQTGGYDDEAGFEALAARVRQLDDERDMGGNQLFYLSTPPSVFQPITYWLHHVGLCSADTTGTQRIVIEKPFGIDLASAHDLNRHLLALFEEDQIFRIDHYLGKETVQNILVFRFGNGIFEPVWNRNYIDQIQITVAETLGIGDHGGYYDKAGAFRDMLQNHMMQLVAFTAMEPPVAFDPEAVRDQKVNVLRSIRPLDPQAVADRVVHAQYGPGVSEGTEIPGYLNERDIPPDSLTETFVAWKVEIDNWRWQGVPFYLRTGKALATKVTEVNIVFRKPPLLLFETLHGDRVPPSNVLMLRIQPDESIRLYFDAKRPGPAVNIERVAMDFSYREHFGSHPAADAYERLLLDAILGDTTLFIRRDEIELAWERATQVLEGWELQEEQARQNGAPLQLPKYAAGTWGPKEAHELLARDRRYWRNPYLSSVSG